MKRAPWSRTAFTLVEVLIVIAIIGMLAGLGTAAVRMALSKARQAAVFIEIDQLSQALNAYKERTREYPPAFAETNANGELDYSNKKRFIQHLLFAFPGFNPESDTSVNGDLIEQQYSMIRNEILANYKVKSKTT
ncbi:MAG: prepilin-type N-terminal cleavage/methylation domain-containing protein, partial [Planctomycetaceae bacterium]|nr:prepilin-type N-terminal cleavage/methylation domain-containing protein [Planctomycetaceae bacterium]